MKKILPILSIIALPTILCACNDDHEKANMSFNSYKSDIANFQKCFKEYSNLNEDQLNKVTLNKYRLSISAPEIVSVSENDVNHNNVINDENVDVLDDTKQNESEQIEPETDTKIDEVLDEQQPTVLPNTKQDRPIVDGLDGLDENVSSDEKNEISSTLYSLTEDVDQQCDEFCELKQKLTKAIVETQNMIDKVNKNELDLTNEQRIFLTQQTSQLRNLSNNLSAATSELAFSVSDLNKMITAGGSTDNLAVKYLLILDNLAHGNQMLEQGLATLNIINYLMATPQPYVGNNYGRILYGFGQNGEKPIIHDYLIDKDGNIKENLSNEESDKNSAGEETEQQVQSNDRLLKPNIDTFGNYCSNIDTFFNTALLNRYNWGRSGFGGYGMPFGGYGMFGVGNPYLGYNGMFGNEMNNNQPNNTIGETTPNQDATTTTGAETNLNTQYTDNNKTVKTKKFKLTKNIDTYKDADTLSPKQRFAMIKSSINEFFSRFKKPNNKDIQNPIYNMENDENNVEQIKSQHNNNN